MDTYVETPTGNQIILIGRMSIEPTNPYEAPRSDRTNRKLIVDKPTLLVDLLIATVIGIVVASSFVLLLATYARN